MADDRRTARRSTGAFIKVCLERVRPPLLAALAAVGFALLLRWHHGQFEQDMVRNFQQYQSRTAAAISDSVERRFRGLVRDLRLTGALPETRLLGPQAREVVRIAHEAPQSLLRTVFVVDAEGKVLCRAADEAALDTPGWPAPSEVFPAVSDAPDETWHGGDANGATAWILIPIRSEGRLAGGLGCEVDLSALLTECLAHSGEARRGRCWVVSPGGTMIHRDKGQATGDAPERLALEAAIKAAASGARVRQGGAELFETQPSAGGEGLIVACTPLLIGESRYGLAVGTAKSTIAVPLQSHERVIFALIGALALLYFATGYLSYRSEKAHRELAEQRERAAETASKAKSDFLAKMSHEIRTPMHGILGMTELVLDSDLAPQQRRCLDLAKRSADSLLNVINDILDISKIEAGRFKLTVVPFNLRDCLADTVEPFVPQARSEGIDLTLHLDPAVPGMVIGDPGRLRQVVTNLLGNAMKFTRHGSIAVAVTVAEETPESVRLSFEVRDTGIGIPAEKQGRIFHAFEQSEGVADRRYGGTGLGLAISAQLVEMMSGKLGVESEVGKGSRFFFDVRLRLLNPESGQSAATSMKAMQGMRVLIAGIDEVDGVRLSHLLSTWQMKPKYVRSGGAALAELRRAQAADKAYQLAILDTCLSDMEGFELAGRIRQMPDGDKVALIVFASGVRGDGDRCGELGVRAYLTRPVDAASLLRAIAASFDNSAGRRLITRHWLRENLRRLRILAVDDDPVNLEHARLLLEKWGHKVTVARDGQQALDALATKPFDLVLMDVQMPVMDGLSASRAIRRAEQGTGRHIPIVAMTADAMADAKPRCLQAGMDDYVSKPVLAEELMRIIEAASRKQAKIDREPESAPVRTEGEPTRAEAAPAEGAQAKSPEDPTQEEPMELSKALEFAGGSRATLNRLGGLFVDGLPETIADMRCALDAHSADMLRKATHRLRGSAGLFGAKAVCSAAERLSREVKAGDWAGAARAMDTLERQLDRLAEALSRLEQTRITVKKVGLGE